MPSAQTPSPVVEPVETPTPLPLGPDSLAWRYFADHRMALLGPRAAVLQNMLPSLGQGVEEHSVWFAETLARLQRSIPPIFNTVYGADGAAAGRRGPRLPQADQGQAALTGRRTARSTRTPTTGRTRPSSSTPITATDTFIRRLTEAEKEQLFRESITWFERYGVSARHARGPRRSSRSTGATRSTSDWSRTAPRRTASATPPRAGRDPKQGAGTAVVARTPTGQRASAPSSPSVGCRARGPRAPRPAVGRRSAERRYQRFAARLPCAGPVVLRRLPGTLRMHPIALRAFQREGRRA